MKNSIFSCLFIFYSMIYCSRLTQGKAIYAAYDENSNNDTGTFIKNEIRNSTPTTKPLLDLTTSNVKAIDNLIKVENTTNEINTLIENENYTTSTTKPQPNDIMGKAINTAINFKNKIIDISMPIVNDYRNSTANSTIPFIPDSIYELLPPWGWIVLGITLTLILCCLCCCPHTLGQILGCPFACLYKILLFIFKPVRCCLSCLGFDKIGVRAQSVASGFQSTFYGGNTPSGSFFSCCQSHSMR